jgi:hypothetical protein
MNASFTAHANSEPKVIKLIEGLMVNHPNLERFWIMMNGPVFLDVGAGGPGILGRYNIQTFPPNQWISLRDQQNTVMPVEVFIQPFAGIWARWLDSAESSPPT